jgi:hypothetical protein
VAGSQVLDALRGFIFAYYADLFQGDGSTPAIVCAQEVHDVRQALEWLRTNAHDESELIAALEPFAILEH